MKKYLVGIREINLRYFEVMAGNEKEAKQLVASNQQFGDNCDLVTDCETMEYSNVLPIDDWLVKEL